MPFFKEAYFERDRYLRSNPFERLEGDFALKSTLYEFIETLVISYGSSVCSFLKQYTNPESIQAEALYKKILGMGEIAVVKISMDQKNRPVLVPITCSLDDVVARIPRTLFCKKKQNKNSQTDVSYPGHDGDTGQFYNFKGEVSTAPLSYHELFRKRRILQVRESLLMNDVPIFIDYSIRPVRHLNPIDLIVKYDLPREHYIVSRCVEQE